MPTPTTLNVSGIFVTGSSFTGKYTIPNSPSATIILQSVIDEWERKTIMRLLGVELGKLLIAYKEAQPNSDPPVQRYDDLIAAFDLQNTIYNSYPFCQYDKIYSSLGIEDFLAAVIYYYYMMDDQVKASQSGQVRASVETAEVVSGISAAKKPEAKYNLSLQTCEAIQWFCQWKTDDTTGANVYPEYSGLYIAPQYGSII